MQDWAEKRRSSSGEAAPDRSDGPIRQLGFLSSALLASPARGRVALLVFGIVAVICLNAAAQIRLNGWQGAFFDALGARALPAFLTQLLVFVPIMASLLVLVVAQTWLQEMTKVRLREWLTRDLLDQWLAPRRACLLAHAGEIGVNPDQRMQEDARHLSELSAELGVGLLQATLLLVSFIGVLWVLSAHVVFGSGDGAFSIPGYMVWCALGYALTGSTLTWRVGRPLIRINAERYAREAKLRFALVRVNECAEAIALHGGEADERRALDGTVDQVVQITSRLAGGLARLTWITSGYGWLAIVAPVLVAAPGYFQGSMSFGGLMMVVGAFNQVQQALRWFVDNFSRIADWRATLLRVVSFRRALLGLEEDVGTGGSIRRVDAPAPALVIDRLSVALAEGRARLDEPRVEIEPGERVLIVGEPGAGKSTLFRALAGLWPWGGGSLQLPPRASMMFMPHRPYLPPGTLRGAIAYPSAPDAFAAGDIEAALARLGLDRLTPALDRERRWDRELSLDDQQRLAFVRLLLHRPRWVFLDDAMGALGDAHRQAVLDLFDEELRGTAVVGISRSAARQGFYGRVLRLVRHGEGPPAFLPQPAPAPAPVPPIPALAESALAEPSLAEPSLAEPSLV